MHFCPVFHGAAPGVLWLAQVCKNREQLVELCTISLYKRETWNIIMTPSNLRSIPHCHSNRTSHLCLHCSHDFYLLSSLLLTLLDFTVIFTLHFCLWKLPPITSKSLLQTDKACMTLPLLPLSNRSSLCPVSIKTSNLSFLSNVLFILTAFIFKRPD